MTQIKTKIPAELEPAAVGGMVTDSKYVIDREQNKTQTQINTETDERITTEKTRAEAAEEALDGRVDTLEDAVGTGGSVDSRIYTAVATEKQRAEGVEGGLNTRLQTVEQLASISVGGGDIGIGTAADFESDDPEDQAKVPTVAAMLGGANDGVYDISARHSGATYADLAAALGTDGANVPVGVRRGGMSVKFVQTSDNNYIRYNLIADEFTTDVTKWAIDDAGVYVDNPEYIHVEIDKDNRILWAIKSNGEIYWGAGVPQQVIDYVNSKIQGYNLDEVVTFLGSLVESDKTLQDLLDEIDEVIPKLVDNPEWLSVTTDSNGRILEGIKRDGTKIINEFQIEALNIIEREITDINTSLNERGKESVMLGFNDSLEKIDLNIIGKNISLGNIGVGNVVSLTPENVSGWGYVIIPCSQEDIFYISASGGSNPRAYGFIDSNNVLLTMAPAYTAYDMQKIVAPLGANKLIINSNQATTCFKGNAQIINRVDELYDKHYEDVYSTPEDSMYAYINGLRFTEELTNPIADLTKTGDKMVHVSTFKIINGKIYATYYVNRINATETPSEHLARFVVCDLADPTDIQYYDVGFTFNSKQPETPNDLWHIEGDEVTQLYDTVLLTIDDNTLFILWTAQAGGKYYRVYRTYNITTGIFSDVQLNYYKVGNDTAVFNSANMELLYTANGIEHRPFASDIGLMQKLSSRIENGVTYYYSGIYYYNHTAIVKTTDLITWEFVASPDFVWPYADILWENAVYVKNEKVFYMQRLEPNNNYAILATYDLVDKLWSNPIRVQDAQSRYDFIEFNNKLYCAHSPKDRNHIAIMRVDTGLVNRSYDVQVAVVPDYFYPFMQTYNGELYMSYTASRQHIYLSRITIGSIPTNTIDTVFKDMFNI